MSILVPKPVRITYRWWDIFKPVQQERGSQAELTGAPLFPLDLELTIDVVAERDDLPNPFG